MHAIRYVVKREIEGKHCDFAAFETEQEARDYFDDAYHTCWNDSDGSHDGLIVTNCWLMWVQTDKLDRALAVAEANAAFVLDVCFPPDDP
jgi:hypothetical protein